MFAKQNLLTHFKAISEVLVKRGLEATLDPVTFHLVIHGESGSWGLFPQFITRVEKRKAYTPTFDEHATMFIGWMPYFNKQWKIAQRKLAFKGFASRSGLLTPEYAIDNNTPMRDVIVKGDESTFAEGILGPFADSRAYTLQEGQYFERFIRGRIAKIWYWNSQPVCLELIRQPQVVGDGQSSIRQLVQAALDRRQIKRDALMGDVEQMLAYQGKHLDMVPAAGEQVAADFRYGSVLLSLGDTEEVDLTAPQHALAPQALEALRHIGNVLWNKIPGDIREQVAFTVDAVVTDDQQVYALEMNCNPFIHPGIYSTMLNNWLDQVDPSTSVKPLRRPRSVVPEEAVALPDSLSIDELLALAEAEVVEKQYEPALLRLKRVMAYAPNDTRALLMSARLYSKLGLFARAKELYQRHADLRPNSIVGLFELGLASFELDELDAAQGLWQQALELSPNYAPALFYSARLHVIRGSAPAARELLESLVRTAEQDDPFIEHAQRLIETLPTARLAH